MPGRGAKVAIAGSRLELRSREANRAALTATDDLGGSEDARIAWLLEVVGAARTTSSVGNRGYVCRLGENPIVPHRIRGQFARVMERHLHFGALFLNLQRLLFEAHEVGRVDV